MHFCHTNLTLFIISINVSISATFDFAGVQVGADIDENDTEIEDYKRHKLQRPTVFEHSYKRIVGGRSTTIENYPYIVSLQTNSYFHLCGGSIIHKLWVVSASHCVSECESVGTDPCTKEFMKDPNDYLIVAGKTDVQRYMDWGQIREIQKFIKHPGFSRPLLLNDIALIKLKNPFHFCVQVKAIVLPQLTELNGKDVSERYKECLAIGWGGRTPRTGKHEEDLTDKEKLNIDFERNNPMLMIVNLPVIRIEACKALINKQYITNRHLCTMYKPGGKDACEGDSGGPLVCQEILYGVTSWGHGCALPGVPGVFTRVDTYGDWIQRLMSGGPNVDYYSSSNKIAFFNCIFFFSIFHLNEVVILLI